MKVGDPKKRNEMMVRLRANFASSGQTLPDFERLQFELYLVGWQSDRLAYGGDHEAAIQGGAKMLELAQQRGDRKGLAFVNNTVGEYNRLAGHYEQAAHHYQEARRWWLEVDDQTDVAIATMNLAMIRTAQRQFETAVKNWDDALERLEQVNHVMASRLRPAAMGVWAACGDWVKWHRHVADGIKFAAGGATGIDVLDAYADACLLSHENGAPPQNQAFAQAIRTGLFLLKPQKSPTAR